MKRLVLLTLVLLTASIANAAFTKTYMDAIDPDLSDLDHYTYVFWQLNDSELQAALADGETIKHAVLVFDNIRNWSSKENILYVNLLNDPIAGVVDGVNIMEDDDQEEGNNVGSTYYPGSLDLFNVSLTTTAADLVYHLDAAETAVLSAYALDNGVFVLGFDPDCHYYNDGVSLYISTVPAPGAITLGGLGTLFVGWLRRRRSF